MLRHSLNLPTRPPELMKRIPLQHSKRWLTGAAAGLATFTGGERVVGATWVDVSDSIRRAATLDRFHGGYENILGTSLDLIVETARPAEAAECEARLLGEIERLRRILSTYDPASEISRVMAGAPIVSPELAELLAAYDDWAARTDGLVSLHLGGVIATWREAARTGRLPDRTALVEAAQHTRAFNVDALGKGFIIDRAVAVARRIAPGGLVNLGGDLRAWGETAWPVAVADPRNPAENAPPLARFTLREAAVATSGGYARNFTVGGKRFSHLVDPRSFWPLDPGGSATVVARDGVTANALSTAASIGGAAAGARLAQAHGSPGYLFAEADGRTVSGGLIVTAMATDTAPPPRSEAGAAAEKAAPVVAEAKWPEGFQVAVQVVLKKHTGPKQIYRPYVAVWIENAGGHVVRTLTIWGEDERYERKLSTWMRQIRDVETPYTVARATRPPGAYTVAWNGKDDYGRPLPAGDYSIRLEICREDGNHVTTAASIACRGGESAEADLAATAESDASTIAYGPAKS